MTVKVQIQYHLVGISELCIMELQPEEYFDLKYQDDDEELSLDSIPIYNHAIEYLGFENHIVLRTKTLLEDDKSHDFIETNEIFWNDGENRIIENISSIKSIRDQLFMVSIQDKKTPLKTEIIRFLNGDMLELEYHGIITNEIDGSQSEIIIYPSSK